MGVLAISNRFAARYRPFPKYYIQETFVHLGSTLVQPLLEKVMDVHLVLLAAFFVQSQPPAPTVVH